MKKLFPFMLLILPFSVSGQNVNSNRLNSKLNIRLHICENGIILRFFPADYLTWKRLTENGISIERVTLTGSDSLQKKADVYNLTPIPLKPLDSTKWHSTFDTMPEARFVYECLYRNTQKVSDEGIGDVLEIEKQASNCFMFSSLLMLQKPPLAFLSGLALADLSVKKNSSYLYRISCSNEFMKDTINIFADFSQKSQLFSLSKPRLEQKNNRVLVHWNSAEINTPYYGLFIEKSIDSGKTFALLNTKPIIPNLTVNGLSSNFYNDSVSLKGTFAFYRIRGIDYFGNLGPPSESSEMKMKPAEEHYPMYLKQFRLNESAVYFSWEYATEAEAQLMGFNILRADSINGFYEKDNDSILGSQARKYYPHKDGYYIVKAVEKNGGEQNSLPILISIPDNTPSSPPRIISSEIDTNGIVKIRWKRNQEKDLHGFRIMRGNFRTHELSALNKGYIKDTFLIDTVQFNFLLDSIYYALIAVDLRYNESESTKLIALKLPDKTPPMNPLLHQIKNTDSGVIVAWYGVKDRIAYYEIKRITASDDPQLVIIKKIASDIIYFKDNEILDGSTYIYSLIAVGINGKRSKSSPPLQIQIPKTGLLPKMEFNAAVNDSAHNKMLLFWDNPTYDNISHYRILEKDNLGNSHTLGTAFAGKQEFIFHYQKPYKPGKYSIIVYLKDGRRSRP